MIWYWYFPRKSRLRLGGQIRHRFLLLSFRLLPFLPSSATAITFTISERKPGLSLQPQLYYTCPFFILLPPSPSTKFEIKLLFSFFASPLSPPPPSSGKSFFLHRPGPGNGKFFESEHSLFSPMGEAPLISEDELHKGFSNGFHVKSGEYQEATLVVDDKEYVIGGINDGLESSIAVRVIEKTTGKWSVPTVLGIKPKPCEKVLSLALNGDRILLIKKDAPADDTIWFLEINTKFVRDHRKSFGTEVVAWSKGVIGDAQIPIVISGPSGVGKGTLISKLMEEFPSNFGFSVSHTTRAPRIKEKNGIHYHFTERNIMEKEIMDGKFLEFASVHDNLYGTSIEAVEVVTDSGKRCILDIDVQGARSVRASPLEALFIFIRPPSFTELENRLRARGTETEEQIQKRLRNAKAEIEQGLSSGIFDHILENNDLDECYDNLKKLLDLDGGAETFNESSPPKMEINLPVNHVLSRVGDKIFINCGIQGLPNESDTEFVLDVSCLKGGAPGRTRGLEVNTKESCLDSKTGMKELS